jgi:putative endonuclease
VKAFFVYLARCADGTYYCGAAKDLGKRLAEHNRGTGAKYTRSRKPVKLVYAESRKTRGESLKREAEIKKMGRKQKQALVNHCRRAVRNNKIVV